MTRNRLINGIAWLSALFVLPAFLLLANPVSAEETTSTTQNQNRNISNLGELIVLNNLFNGGLDNGNGEGVSDIGELIVLNNLFDGGLDDGNGDQNISRLGELIVLNNLFNDGSEDRSNLAELIVLNNLFMND